MSNEDDGEAGMEPRDATSPDWNGRNSGGSMRDMQRSGANQAGSRRGAEVPDFGPEHLIGELDTPEKIVREMDRQMRGGSQVMSLDNRTTRRRTDALHQLRQPSRGQQGAVSHAAMGDEILQGTSGMAERSEIRSGASTFNVSNDSTPLTHTYTRMVNVAVVDRPNLPFSEQAQASQSPGADAEQDDRHFTVKETTVMPQRTGMSLLMFDLCCAAPRVQQRKPGRSMSGQKIIEKDPMPQTSSWTQGRELRPLSMQRTERDRASRGWDPSVDAHLTRWEKEDPAENERGWAMGKGQKVSRGGGWT